MPDDFSVAAPVAVMLAAFAAARWASAEWPVTAARRYPPPLLACPACAAAGAAVVLAADHAGCIAEGLRHVGAGLLAAAAFYFVIWSEWAYD